MLVGVGTCGEATAPEIFGVDVQPEVGLAVGIGGTVHFYVTTVDRVGHPQYYQGAADWSTGDARVATVDGRGVATGIAEGWTTVTATIAGVSATASLEVYVPERVAEYVPGVSYFGRKGYIEYIPGELPVVLSAPHGGDLLPDEIPNRTFGVTGTDRNTEELTLAVRDALVDLTGLAPHVVVSHLHRAKLDPNREIVEAAQGNAFAGHAWEEFQSYIETGRLEVIGDFGAGMYFDMHGHGHPKSRLELGYLLSADRLNGSDASLNSLSVVQLTSIRELGRTSPDTFAEIVRGATSLGGLLQAEGVAALPSPDDPSPGGDPYFTGGYNTRRHGSLDDSEMVSGIQIEHHYPGLRDTDTSRRVYAAKLAVAIRSFMLEHFGFFEPTP
jgi:hypothetical protein